MKTNPFSKKIAQILLTVSLVTVLLISTSVLAASGILDSTFGTNGVAITDLGSNSDSSSSIALQADGKILLLGSAQGQTPSLMRYNANGVTDNTFGTNGKLSLNFGRSVAVQSDGKLVVAGSSNGSIAVARYTSDGKNLDNTFGINGVVMITDENGFSRYSVSDLAIEANGRIVVVGTESNQGNFTNFFVAHLNSDGSRYDSNASNGFLILDKTDFPNNRFNNGRAVAIQANGKIVVSGDMTDDNGAREISLVRINPDNSLDTTTFGKNGKGTVMVPLANFYQSNGAIAIQADGKIIVVGTIINDDETIKNLAVVRFNSNGVLDTTFNKTGKVITDFGANEYGADVHLQADGKIVVVATSSTASSDSLLLVRYNKDGSLDKTFGASGKLVSDLGNGSASGAGIKIQPDGKVVAAGSSNGDVFLARYIVGTLVTTTFKSAAAYDGWILESAEYSNIGGTLDKIATTFNVGDDAKNRQYIGIISFNTAALPDKAVITSVQLNLKKQGVIGTDPFTTHGDLLFDIRNSAFSNNLVLQPVDFAAPASPGSIQEHASSMTTSSWCTVNLNNANLSFISKVGTTQIRVLFSMDDNNDFTADYLKFFSGSSTAANRPQLIVTYYVP